MAHLDIYTMTTIALPLTAQVLGQLDYMVILTPLTMKYRIKVDI